MNFPPHSHSHIPESVLRLFQDQVIRKPEAIATVSQNQHITYQELNTRSNQLAHYLRRHGVGPETRVGVCLDRSLDLVIGLLGILKAGGTYVPVDPELPSSRVAFMLEDSSAVILITQNHLKMVLPDLKINLICLDKDWVKMARESQGNPFPRQNLESLAYVIYTSGSTGQPKGVGISRGALKNFLMAFQAKIGMEQEDRLLSGTPISFDMGVPEIWLPLTVGAQVCVAPKTITHDGKQLAKLIGESNISVMQGTPAMWQMLFEAGWEGSSLRKIVCGGDTLSPQLAHKLLGRGSEVWNSYGPTEATVWSTALQVQAGEKTVSIGTSLANTEIFILDQCGSPAPLGTRGELYIGGTSLARGYMNRPDVTAEKFLPSPWFQIPGDRLYRTGDLARLRNDGNLEFCGRSDHQVKVRGFRIEVGEIEIALCRHPAVQQAVVKTRTDSLGEKQLVAYLLLKRKSKVTPNDLRQSLMEHLPEYMIPSLFIPLDAFPLTPHGKIDRKSMPIQHFALFMRTEEFVAPRTHVETLLERIWSEVLGVPKLGVYDNFFEIGGHSLFATQIVSRIRERFNQEFPLTQLFRNPTIACLANLIEMEPPKDRALLIPPIKPVPRHTPMPLSFSQERVWFIQQLDKQCKAYQFQCGIRFKGRLDIPALETSLNQIVHRHEIYRTTFPLVESSVVQAVHPYQPFDLPVFLIEASSQDEQQFVLRKKIREELEEPFDLQQQPLIRWMLLKIDDLDHVLIHVEHHLVHDGWSFHVFLREFLEIYKGLTLGQPTTLAELPHQFVDFSWWERTRVENGHLQSQLAYWKKTLAGCPSTLTLPYDYPRPKIQTFNGSAPRVELPPELSQAVRHFSRQEKMTLFIAMFTAFVGLLYRFTGQDDLCIGTAIANRRLREFEAGIGMFVNNVVLRIRPGKGMVSTRDLLRHVGAVTQEAYDHQDIPFDHVVKELQPERDPSRNPLFQTTFSFHDSPLPNIQIPELEVSVLEILSNNTAKFDLNVIVLPWSNKDYAAIPRTGDEGITLIWEYNTDLFNPKTIETLIESYHTFLQGMIANPDQPISTLPLLTDSQVTQQVVEWNNTHRDYPTDATITCLFEDQVEKFPDRVSVVFQDQQLSYQELNVRANQLARYLQTQGVRRGDFVGIFIERSLEMVIAVCATLKAGAAYVPIDPYYPGERVTFMLHDAQVQVLVTQEHLRPRVPLYHGRIVCVDTDWPNIGRLPSTRIPRHEQGDDLAYMIYTSGSTGQPKGAMNTHCGIGNRLHWMQAAHNLQPDDRVLQKAPFSFDVSVRELFWPLLAGARLIMADPEAHRDSQYLRNLILLEDITTIHFVPSMLQNVLQTPGIESCGTILRRVLSGGETLSEDLRTKYFDRLPSVDLHNLYGPTEAAVDVTEWHCRPDIAHATVPIGRPIPNIQIYLLDAQQQLVPSGLPGELHIGGVGLARGYHRRPALTAATFIPDPLSSLHGSRLYKTGDLCRYQSDGTIAYLRRRDNQVKIRGFRIEPGEIEAVLLKHPEVKMAAVICREDCSGEKRLVAYVTGEYEGRAKPDVRAYLKDQIPEYMIPQAFVFLEVFPFTPNGKLDRLALPEPDHVDRPEGMEYVAPRTMMEKVLVEVWQEVLKVEKIGMHDNFFYMGGHSLLATQIMIRLQNLLEIPLPLRLFFEFPILEGLAKEIDSQLQESFSDEGKDYSEAVN